MGKELSKPKVRKPSEHDTVRGTLPIGELVSGTYNIENVVFASGGSLSYSYAGAVRVLEKIGIMNGIKRFAGVGTGAIIAALLAVGFDSDEIHDILDQTIYDLIDDDQAGFDEILENLTEKYGWNCGFKFRERFNNLITSKLGQPSVTFLQLYEQTDKELCIVAANVDKFCLEHFHPKTTPDLPITTAIFTSLSIPGIFTPIKYCLGSEEYHFVNGSLLCSYPIHCFDGSFLSMDSSEYLLNQLKDPSLYTSQESVFSPKNERTIGFYPVETHQEANYKELKELLTNAKGLIKIPETTIGRQHKSELQEKMRLKYRFKNLRNSCINLMAMVDSSCDEDETISLEVLINKIFAGDLLSKEDRMTFFPECGREIQAGSMFLKFLQTEGELKRKDFTEYIERKLLDLLDQFSSHRRAHVNSLHMYFGSVFEAKRHSTNELSKSDFDRTVSIFCRHVGSRNINFEDDDQTFLYFQGWNATVAFLKEKNTTPVTDNTE